jgi:hypothetical protein
MAKIDRFVENYPDQVANDFKSILRRYLDREISEALARRLMKEKIDVGFSKVKMYHRKENLKKGIGGRNFWYGRELIKASEVGGGF